MYPLKNILGLIQQHAYDFFIQQILKYLFFLTILLDSVDYLSLATSSHRFFTLFQSYFLSILVFLLHLFKANLFSNYQDYFSIIFTQILAVVKVFISICSNHQNIPQAFLQLYYFVLQQYVIQHCILIFCDIFKKSTGEATVTLLIFYQIFKPFL